jgi:hypothetical protein
MSAPLHIASSCGRRKSEDFRRMRARDFALKFGLGNLTSARSPPDEEDYALSIYAERIPVNTVIGAPQAWPRLLLAFSGRQRWRVITRAAVSTTP